MKKLLIIFSVLFALLLREECHGQGTVKYTAGISYGVGDPTYTPQGNVSKKYVNLTTLRSYTYSGTAWVLDGRGIDVVIGCAAPAYTPGLGQSNIAINNCTLLQNGQGPELYVFDGTYWIFINEKSTAPTYTAGTGIGITGTVISNTGDLSATNELQNLSLTGQTLGISSGNTVTVPVIAVAPGTGIGVSNSAGTATVTNTGDLSNTNELQTISAGTNTLTLSNSGGTVTVDTDPTNDITSLSGGTGISISGSGNSRTIANTGDLSATNELQTISISGSDITLSNGGGTVSVPGGGVTWSLRGPNGSANGPTYSFENDTTTGIYKSNKGLELIGPGFRIRAVDSESGGNALLSAGSATDGSGGSFTMTAGNGTDEGGAFTVVAGESTIGQGGSFSMAAGNGASGGTFIMNAGEGVDGGGGLLISGGSAVDGDAGGATIAGGNSLNSTGGAVIITGGDGINDKGGEVFLIGGNGVSGSKAAIEINNILRITPITVSVRDAIIGKKIGYTVYCSNATANDSSTGVMQTWNGSVWKNLW